MATIKAKALDLTSAEPNYKGPRLSPFPFPRGSDRTVELMDEIGQGLHSRVYKARICGELYALKMFKFVMHSDTKDWEPVQKGQFNRECRAYDRLSETGNEHLAVRCYGHLALHEHDVGGLGGSWDREPEHGDSPIRCIVARWNADHPERRFWRFFMACHEYTTKLRKPRYHVDCADEFWPRRPAIDYGRTKKLARAEVVARNKSRPRSVLSKNMSRPPIVLNPGL